MKKNECIARVLPDGNLSLPPTFANQLKLKVNSKIRIIVISDAEKKGLSRFCGKWQDERSAEELVSEVYSEREKNNQRERQPL
jgi:hypothetical protein